MMRYNPVTGNMSERDYSNLLTGVIYEGAYVCVSDIDGNVYAYDTVAENFPFTEKTNIEEIAISGASPISVTAILPLGDRLMIRTDNDTVWNLDQSNPIRDKAYLVSSIY